MSDRPLFPPECAFVVHFIDDLAAADEWRGRVEHVVSGRTARFDTSAGLFDSIAELRRTVTGE